MASFESEGRACVVFVAAALAACGSSSSGAETPAPAGSLCPRCLAGGETTDFDGDRECSGIDASPLDTGSELAGEFALDELLSRLEQPLRSSFGWRRRPGGAGATGYEAQTEVEFQIEVLQVSHGQWEVAGPRCSDFLLLDARIHVQTADGALSGTFERPLLLPRNTGTASLEALGFEDSLPQIGLRDFTGTLDLGLDEERIYDGSIALSFSVGPGGISGRLGLYMWYRESDNSRWLFTPLQAQWPSDGCDDGWQPVDPDQPLADSDERTARDYWRQSRASFAETFPVSATWLDGTETQITLEPGELEGACWSLATPAAYYLRVPLQIRSADGRIETTRAAQVHWGTDAAEGRVTVEGEATTRARFMEEVPVSGMDWAGTSEATFELRSSRASDSAPSGDLQIFGFGDHGQYENLLYLHWCSGAECDTYPRVRYSPGGLNGIRLP